MPAGDRHAQPLELTRCVYVIGCASAAIMAAAAAPFNAVYMLCLFVTFLSVFAHEFLFNPHFDLEPDYIIWKPLLSRIQRYILRRERLSTFHTRVDNRSIRHFCILFTPKQEGDDMTLTSIPDLTVTNNRKGHLAWSSFKIFVFLLVQPCNIPEMKTGLKIRDLPSTEKKLLCWNLVRYSLPQSDQICSIVARSSPLNHFKTELCYFSLIQNVKRRMKVVWPILPILTLKLYATAKSL